MLLSNEEQQFLAKRSRFVKAWPYVGAILLVMLIGLGMWLFWSKPLLANPFVVLSRLNSSSVPASTMVLMAGLLPVVVLMCVVLAITIVLFAFAAFSNEKKYLAIIKTKTEVAPAMEPGESRQASSAQQSSPADAPKPRR